MKDNDRIFFNAYADSYRRVINSQEFIKQSVLPTLLSTLLDGKKTLDVGNGGIIDYVPSQSTILYSVDSSFEMLIRGDDISAGRNICGDAKKLPLTDSSFDRVLCKFLLHHLVENTCKKTDKYQKECLQQVYQVLKQDGKIIVVENCVSIYIEWFEIISFRVYQVLFKWLKLPRVKFFSLKTLASLIESTGFINLQVHRIEMKTGWELIPFITSFPWLKIPSKWYPFDVVLVVAQK